MSTANATIVNDSTESTIATPATGTKPNAKPKQLDRDQITGLQSAWKDRQQATLIGAAADWVFATRLHDAKTSTSVTDKKLCDQLGTIDRDADDKPIKLEPCKLSRFKRAYRIGLSTDPKDGGLGLDAVDGPTTDYACGVIVALTSGNYGKTAASKAHQIATANAGGTPTAASNSGGGNRKTWQELLRSAMRRCDENAVCDADFDAEVATIRVELLNASQPNQTATRRTTAADRVARFLRPLATATA